MHSHKPQVLPQQQQNQVVPLQYQSLLCLQGSSAQHPQRSNS